jgi:transposase
MIQISPRDKVFIGITPIDFRCGMDFLIDYLKSMSSNPFGGAFFVFINRKKTALKILAYDGQGMWLLQKRLSQGKFLWWPSAAKDLAEIDAKNFVLLLFNGDTKTLQAQENWKNLLAD